MRLKGTNRKWVHSLWNSVDKQTKSDGPQTRGWPHLDPISTQILITFQTTSFWLLFGFMNSKVHQLFILLLVGNDGPGLYGFLFLAKTLKSIYLALILLSRSCNCCSCWVYEEPVTSLPKNIKKERKYFNSFIKSSL